MIASLLFTGHVAILDYAPQNCVQGISVGYFARHYHFGDFVFVDEHATSFIIFLIGGLHRFCYRLGSDSRPLLSRPEGSGGWKQKKHFPHVYWQLPIYLTNKFLSLPPKAICLFLAVLSG